MSYLTKIPGWQDKRDVQPGMAHFARTGPAGKTCGDCAHRGYFRNKDDVRKHYGCARFRQLTDKNGPAVESGWHACKYFNQKSPPTAHRAERKHYGH